MTPEDVKRFIREWAYCDWECGKPMNTNDYDLFAAYCREDGIEPSRDLFEFYYECYDEARTEDYNKRRFKQ